MPRKGFVLMLVSVASAFQLFGQKKKCFGVTRRSAHSDAGIGGNGPMPVEIALRIAKQRAKDGGEAAVVDRRSKLVARHVLRARLGSARRFESDTPPVATRLS